MKSFPDSGSLSFFFSKVNAGHEFDDGDCDTTLYYHGFY